MGTTRIECVACGEPRDVPNASKHLVKRCKSCQDEYNRQRALERYYERTGRNPKKAKAKVKKKKEEEEKPDQALPTSNGGFLSGIMPVQPAPKNPTRGKTCGMSEEEATAFWNAFYEKLYGPNWEDGMLSDDDW